MRRQLASTLALIATAMAAPQVTNTGAATTWPLGTFNKVTGNACGELVADPTQYLTTQPTLVDCMAAQEQMDLILDGRYGRQAWTSGSCVVVWHAGVYADGGFQYIDATDHVDAFEQTILVPRIRVATALEDIYQNCLYSGDNKYLLNYAYSEIANSGSDFVGSVSIYQYLKPADP